MREINIRSRKMLRLFLLLLLCSMGMSAHVQAAAKAVAMTVGQKKQLPVNAKKPGTIRAGDLMLYGDDCVVLFYKTFQSSYSYTKIGHISNIRGLEDLLGNGNIIIHSGNVRKQKPANWKQSALK